MADRLTGCWSAVDKDWLRKVKRSIAVEHENLGEWIS